MSPPLDDVASTTPQGRAAGRLRRPLRRLPLGLRLYRVLTRLAAPLVPALLKRRAQAGKEDPRRLGERLGHASTPRPPGPLVWLHGASVGEALMLVTLIEPLRDETPGLNILITTGTVTSAALLRKRLPTDAIHQFAPVDRIDAVRRFLDHWRPDAGVFAESELWPNLLLEAEAAGLGLALVNARMTAQSLNRWSRRRRAARRLLSAFAVLGAADARTAEGLTGLMGRPVERLGNLKHAAGAPPVNSAAAASLQTDLQPRGRIWLAASTHPGEDTVMLAAHAQLRATENDALLLLAPRHPERGDAIAAEAEAAGFRTSRRAIGDLVDAHTAVYVVDTLGEMGLWLDLADAAFIAGSLVEGVGGHTPLEAAWTRTPLITGPLTGNFADLYAELEAAGGVRRAASAADIAAALLVLAPDTAQAEAASTAAHAVAAADRQVLDRYVALIRPLLPAPSPLTTSLPTPADPPTPAGKEAGHAPSA